MAKDIFFKEDIQMAKRYLKRSLESLIISKIQIKTTVRYFSTPVSISITKKIRAYLKKTQMSNSWSTGEE